MKRGNFIVGFLLGALLFGGTTAFAAGILATPIGETGQRITLNGDEVILTGYNINGNNYFKLRDIAEAVDFGVTWEADSHTVAIDTESPYVPESQLTQSNQSETVDTEPTGTYKPSPGGDYAREDFSQDATPDIFDDIYTRAAYNTIRQTIVDRELILDGNVSGYNTDYIYAHTTASAETKSAMVPVLSHIGVHYRYQFGVEPGLSGLYNYPNYFICKVELPEIYASALSDAAEYISEMLRLSSDDEKVRYINDVICDKLTYKASTSCSPQKLFADNAVHTGNCSTYARNFKFLCDIADIPCIIVSSSNHSWNMVYADNEWLYVDCVANDVGDELSSRDALLLAKSSSNSIRVDADPQGTAFAKELLVPGSAK